MQRAPNRRPTESPTLPRPRTPIQLARCGGFEPLPALGAMDGDAVAEEEKENQRGSWR